MRIGVVTLFPEMFDAVIDYGITSRAVDNGLLQVDCWNPRDYTTDRHQTVDGRPYGGGPGMVMKIEPMRAAIHAARAELNSARVIYLSPQGRMLDQRGAAELAAAEQLILVTGRYEGIDERLLEAEIDEEWSVGDYVLSGGELAAMVLIDAVTRLLPGALGDDQSAQQDSFSDGLLEFIQIEKTFRHFGNVIGGNLGKIIINPAAKANFRIGRMNVNQNTEEPKLALLVPVVGTAEMRCAWGMRVQFNARVPVFRL